MKKLVSIAIACAFFALPVSAQDVSSGRTIIVQTESSDFAANLGREMERQLYRVSYPGGHKQSGVVRVRFLANGDGLAENISLFDGSGSNSMDRAALRAVHHLNRLGSTTRSRNGGQDVLLSIVFATSEREAERLAERVNVENAALIASGRLNPQVLAVTTVPATRS